MSCERQSRIRAMFDTSGFGLEIGPSHAPLLPKRDGYNVETIDHADAEELRRKYASQPGLNNIEHVDYVWVSGAIHELVPRRNEYDFIFSSHAIEHIPDFLGYLKSCDLLLKPGGEIVLVIPDKRFTFDTLRPHSTTGEVLQRNSQRASRHSLANVFDGSADFAMLGHRDTWNSLNRGPVSVPTTLHQAEELFKIAALLDGRYVDAHGWCFSPFSFQLIMRDLKELGSTPFKVKTVIETGGLEFYVVLSSETPDNAMSRIELKRWMLLEQILTNVQLLGGSEELKLHLFNNLNINNEIAVI
jgi:SAM-dependent methyltransferase